MDNSSLTAKMREIKASGVTSEAMSRKIGVSFFTVQRWLRDGISAKAHTGTIRLVTQFVESWKAAKALHDLDRFFKQ